MPNMTKAGNFVANLLNTTVIGDTLSRNRRLARPSNSMSQHVAPVRYPVGLPLKKGI
jgi:hypothetical protein